VGLGGLEPPTSSLSAIEGSPLCNPAFLQVVRDRQGRSNALFERVAEGRLWSARRFSRRGSRPSRSQTVLTLKMSPDLHRTTFSLAHAAPIPHLHYLRLNLLIVRQQTPLT
jgi:hypothetical protein